MKLTIKTLLKNFPQLTIINEGDLSKEIKSKQLSRPGLELSGYVEYFPKDRIQILGKQEVSYLEKINYNQDNLERYLIEDIPLIIICRNLKIDQKFIEIAKKNKITIVSYKDTPTKIHTKLYTFLEEELTPTRLMHGVCLSVYGTGIIIKGESGSGKSEIALELINRGHFLIADDSVELKFIDQDNIIARAPKLLKEKLEIRGLGIINVTKLYGATSVLDKIPVELIIKLKKFDNTEDRIGNAIKLEKIENYEIPMIEIPLTIGRNVANLIETAVGNFNLKTKYNYDSAQEFSKELNEYLKEQNE